MEPVFVGIDVAKAHLDVHVRPSGEAFTVPRDGESVANLADRLKALSPVVVVLEATGGFETIVAATLSGAGLPMAVINPRQIRSFARAVGQLAKTDALDAAVIAQFAEAIKPEPRPLADEQTRMLSELVARRRQLVEMMTAERNRRPRLSRKQPDQGARSPPRHAAEGLERDRAGDRYHDPRHADLARARGTDDLRAGGSARRLPAPCWPMSPSSVPSIVRRLLPWSVSHRLTGIAALTEADGPLGVGAPRSERCFTWPLWSPPGTTPLSRASINASSRPGKQKSSPWSLSCAS